MTTAEIEITPQLVVAALLQIALLLAGVAILWRTCFSPAARQQRLDRLPRWELPIGEFVQLALTALAIVLLGQSLFMLLLRPLAGAFGEDSALVTAGIGFQLALLAAALIASSLAQRRGLPRPEPALPARAILVAGVATFAAALPILFLVNFPWIFMLERLGWPMERQDLVDLFARSDSALLVAVMTLLAIVVAPVAEELIFRAGLFRYLRTRVARPVALVVPGLLFGALHGNLAAFVPLVALGIIFSLAYERTGRIIVPIIAHGLFNLNTIVLLLSGLTT